jgi:hypothetical protein
MQATEELLTIAELAVALAGFSGVVVAFTRHGEFTPIDRLRFLSCLSLAMGAAVVSFVPSLLHLQGLSGPSLWQVSSLTFFLFAILYFAIFPLRARRAIRDDGGAPPTGPTAVVAVLSGGNLLAQGFNVLGWPYSPSPSVFVGGLVVWLVVAAGSFAFLVLVRPSR